MTYTAQDVEWLLDVACSYLITLSVGAERRYRPFHQAMVDHLRQPPRARHDLAAYQRRQQTRYTDSLLATIRRTNGGQDWSRASGYLLEQLPAHAAAGGRLNELHRLLADLGWLDAKLADADITAVIADYDLATDPDLQLIQGALRLSAPALVRDPGRLPGQLVGRLLARPQPTIRTFVEQIRSWRGQAWLCPRSASLTPAGGPLQQILTGHTGPVRAVAVAELEGRPVVVSGSEDHTVRIWEPTTGRELHTLEGHTGPVTAVAVAELEGRPVVVSGSADHTVRVWELASGRELHTLTGHTRPVTVVTVVAVAGGWIISGSEDHTVRVWNPQSGQELVSWQGDAHFHACDAALADMRENRLIVAAGDDSGAVHILELVS